MDRTDWAPNHRRCDDPAILRTKPAVCGVVGVGNRSGYCLVAQQIRATDGVGSATVDLGDRLAVDTDYPDRGLVSRGGPPDLHAALSILHSTGDGTGPGRLH